MDSRLGICVLEERSEATAATALYRLLRPATKPERTSKSTETWIWKERKIRVWKSQPERAVRACDQLESSVHWPSCVL
ncbi:unnamed protein product [Bursaphelenchus xylophilus]|uniref:(pine wood nematode) hypothetical protein n=1 Tax=Bursaphelenchus xylophilus TaxID=6326 RepID=A0A1I7SBH8_BURXY|nr:unnamed protein product [Bursaphelenchus xylophilus]CAG9121985.1 unnamed protein product [Bursaphelenchus xylophilus]